MDSKANSTSWDKFKPPNRQNVDNEIEKWDINLITRILRLYGAHRLLWDIQDMDNRNRRLRRAALVDIAAAMGNGFTSAQVARKINILRATYRYERKRIKQRMRKGIGAKTKLKWFSLADSFLREVPKMGKFNTRQERASNESDLEDEMVVTIEPDIVISMERETLKEEDIEFESAIIKVEEESDQDIQDTILENSSDLYTENVTKNVSLTTTKTKWSSEHSLKFVNTLKTQRILWSSPSNECQEDQNVALEFLAEEMNMPMSRIRCRVKKFQQTCKEILEKLHHYPNYKPRYCWWTIAESFIVNNENYLDYENFVDANAILPATPMPYDFDISASPINPIPSVSVPITTLDIDECDESLEHFFTAEKIEIAGDDIATTSLTTQTTKLIYNGLTDDLLEGKWSLKHSVKFLRLYGTHRCLWDLNDPDYRSRELRSAAIEDIAAAMGFGLNADYVAKKIKIFRITYMQHRKRLLKAIKSGQEPDIQLRWFPLADSFLRSHIGLRSIKEQEREIPQFDFQYVMANLNLIDPELLNDFREKLPDSASKFSRDEVCKWMDLCGTSDIKSESLQDYNNFGTADGSDI